MYIDIDVVVDIPVNVTFGMVEIIITKISPTLKRSLTTRSGSKMRKNIRNRKIFMGYYSAFTYFKKFIIYFSLLRTMSSNLSSYVTKDDESLCLADSATRHTILEIKNIFRISH